MTKDEALDTIYATQDAIADMFIPDDDKCIAMQMLVGCAKLITKIDEL